jgi:transposase
MRKFKYYSDEFKLQVIHEVLKGEITKEEARRKYGVGGSSAVINWMRKFGFDPDFPSKNKLFLPEMKKPAPPKKEQEEIKRLESEKSDLELQLKLAQIKLEGYEIMLKIGKEQLGIDLEKKHGAKQLKK